MSLATAPDVVVQAESFLAAAWDERSILDLDKNISNAPDPALLRELNWRAVHGMWWGWGYSACGGYCATKRDGDVTHVVPVLCHRWGCAVCGPRRQAWLRRQIEGSLVAHELHYLWTLTLPHKGTRKAAYQRITRAWNNLNTQLKREYPGLKYLWVVEPHKDGFPHFHLLTDTRIDVRWLRPRWSRAVGGPSWVRAEPVRTAHLPRYMAKYVTKMAQKRRGKGWDFVRGRHLYGKSASVHFTPYRKPSTGEYQLLKRPYRMVEREYVRSGAVVEQRDLPVPAVSGTLPVNWYDLAYPLQRGSMSWDEWQDVLSVTQRAEEDFWPPGVQGAAVKPQPSG